MEKIWKNTGGFVDEVNIEVDFKEICVNVMNWMELETVNTGGSLLMRHRTSISHRSH
jgi:hypothetical protein